jgi:uncharacterized protein
MSRLGRLAVLVALCLGAAPLGAVPLWSVQGDHGTVWLLGSVHLLRAEDQPLPAPLREAYARASRVMLELDPAELAPAAAQEALQRIGVMSPGRSAAEILAPGEWRQAETLAAELGLDLQAIAGLEPWFAALVLYNGALVGAGYDAALGVDQQIADWAARDGKPADGLETLDQQLSLFQHFSPETQRQLLLKTLEELAAIEPDTAKLVATWRAGDVAALARQLDDDFRDFESLRTRIVTDRNRAWLPAIEALLGEQGASLVVVGSLHLVGPEGLPALLEARGYRVTWAGGKPVR